MKTYTSTKEVAAQVRAELKTALPNWKFSVTYKSYSGGSSITLALMSGPLPVLLEADRVTMKMGGEAQLNQYTFTNSYGYGREQLESNGSPLTAAGFHVMEKATRILANHHWDKSDIQTDYFCCNFYMHVAVGKWDKDYQVVSK